MSNDMNKRDYKNDPVNGETMGKADTGAGKMPGVPEPHRIPNGTSLNRGQYRGDSATPQRGHGAIRNSTPKANPGVLRRGYRPGDSDD